ncbi:MAG: hypothetical protein H3C47_07615 [Candidatus Cloacimonetes bacterium]|nr:hypothetical protein [Candidatus Cloacimonadota bacterium]
MRKYACVLIGLGLGLSSLRAETNVLKLEEIPLSSTASSQAEVRELELSLYAFIGDDIKTQGYDQAELMYYRKIFSPRLRLSVREGVTEQSVAEVKDAEARLGFTLNTKLLPASPVQKSRDMEVDLHFDFSSAHKDIRLGKKLVVANEGHQIQEFSSDLQFILEVKSTAKGSKTPVDPRPVVKKSSDDSAFPMLLDSEEFKAAKNPD